MLGGTMQIQPVSSLPTARTAAVPPAGAVDRFEASAPPPDHPTPAQIQELMRTDLSRLEEWCARVPAGTKAPPAIGADGRIYLATDEGVSALNPDGSPRWNWKGVVETGTTPQVQPDGTVLVTGGYEAGGLTKLGSDGQPVWRAALPSSQEEAAALPDGGCYYGDYEGGLHRLRADGSTAWTFTVPGGNHVNGGPAILPDGSAVVIADPGTLHAVNPDGTLKWTRFDQDFGERASTCRQPLMTADGDLLVTGAHDDLFCLDPETGETRWQFLATFGKRMDELTPEERSEYFPWGNTHLSGSPLLSPDGETIYAGGQGGHVTALDRQGNKLWSVDFEEQGYFEPCAVGREGTVFYVGSEGTVRAVSPEGRALWTFKPKDRSQYSFVAAAGDTVYLSTSEGRVHALSSRALERRVARAEAEGKAPVVELTEAEVVIGGVRLPRR